MLMTLRDWCNRQLQSDVTNSPCVLTDASFLRVISYSLMTKSFVSSEDKLLQDIVALL